MLRKLNRKGYDRKKLDAEVRLAWRHMQDIVHKRILNNEVIGANRLVPIVSHHELPLRDPRGKFEYYHVLHDYLSFCQEAGGTVDNAVEEMAKQYPSPARRSYEVKEANARVRRPFGGIE